MQSFDEAKLHVQAEDDGITHFATGIAVFYEGKLLVVHRAANDDFLPSEWELPGGGVEEGETIIDGAKRELFEETGLRAGTVLSIFPGFDYSTPTKPKVRQINLKVTVTDDTIKLDPNEHDDYKYITKQEIDDLKTNDVMRACLYDAFA